MYVIEDEIEYVDMEAEHDFLYKSEYLIGEEFVSKNHNYPFEMQIVDVPKTWNDDDYSGIVFQVEYEDGSYKEVEYNDTDFNA